jgi:hypothetical protein
MAVEDSAPLLLLGSRLRLAAERRRGGYRRGRRELPVLDRRTLLVGFSQWNRRRKARLMSAFMRREGVETVIFVGAALGVEANESVVESLVAKEAKVLAACDVMWTSPGCCRAESPQRCSLPEHASSVAS